MAVCSEQSIYKPFLIWSAIQEEVVGQRFVLKSGMIGLDYEERFFTIPNSGVIREAPFIHFAGQPTAWEDEAKLIVKNITWYRELENRQFSITNFVGIETYLIHGEKLDFVYRSCCT